MKTKIFEQMASKWPSEIVARSEIKNFTGGAVSSKTMANLDSLGQGIAERFTIGRQVCYPIAPLTKWLENRSTPKETP